MSKGPEGENCVTHEAEIRQILKAEFGLDAENLATDAPIFSSGLLDSLSSMKLLVALEAAFGIKISPLDVSLEDVDTIAQIDASVARLKG